MERGGTDSSVLFEEGYIEDLQEFYEREGAVEVISCLRQHAKRLEELDEQLDVSRGYIYERLTEGRGLSLIRIDQANRGDDVYRVHELTPLGETFSKRMEEIGLAQTHVRLWTIRQEFERQKTEFDDWVKDPDGLADRVEEFKAMIDDRSE